MSTRVLRTLSNKAGVRAVFSFSDKTVLLPCLQFSSACNSLLRAQPCMIPCNPSLLTAAFPSSDSTINSVRQLLSPLQSVSSHNNSTNTGKAVTFHALSPLSSPIPQHDRRLAASTPPLPYRIQPIPLSTSPPPQQQQQQDLLSLSHDPGEKDVDSSKPNSIKPAVSLPPKRKPPSVGDRLGLYALSVGFTGCQAIFLAWATHVELVSTFRWEAGEIQTALQYSIPLLVMNSVFLLPEFGQTLQPISISPEAAVPNEEESGRDTTSSNDVGFLTDKESKKLAAVDPLRAISQGMRLAQVRVWQCTFSDCWVQAYGRLCKACPRARV